MSFLPVRPSEPLPTGTIFVVNVMHARPGQQDAVVASIREIVHHASHKPGFLWSTLAASLDGETVVNIEAIVDEANVKQFFSDPEFEAKFERLKELCASEFHLYRTTDAILPISSL